MKNSKEKKKESGMGARWVHDCEGVRRSAAWLEQFVIEALQDPPGVRCWSESEGLSRREGEESEPEPEGALNISGERPLDSGERRRDGACEGKFHKETGEGAT